MMLSGVAAGAQTPGRLPDGRAKWGRRKEQALGRPSRATPASGDRARESSGGAALPGADAGWLVGGVGVAVCPGPEVLLLL